MKSERVCSLSRKLIIEVLGGLMTSADQGLERTLDDSAYRRISIPDSFLLMDAILSILQVLLKMNAVNINTLFFRTYSKACMFMEMLPERSKTSSHFWRWKKQ